MQDNVKVVLIDDDKSVRLGIEQTLEPLCPGWPVGWRLDESRDEIV